ncbi:GDP-mannose 4,6-dehydratase [Methanospirillum lacunae]|uniref:GDP-mannose 4,6-dehydratase n=1 Tax=Methanospirillum lacunae TaxID=668570 RepID=A0A2V2MZK1_9EURY|nr:GDP-mannose 4,6-dehydratase [Methanospirillum lacunae]PWR69738.1 GDP-mannose 4,6-dehydratase [Methanospirillum lacunae]
MKRYLVTGGAGFIGSHLSRALLARGDSVVIFDSLDSGNLANITDLQKNPHLEFIEDTILNKTRLLSICSHIDGIFHLAALVSVQRSIDDPELNHSINVDGMFNVLESARKEKVPKIVFASSAALYGNAYVPPHKESFPPIPLSPYAVGKNLSEMYSSVYSSLYGIGCVCLRFFNVYGPYQDPSSPYSGVISKFLEAVTQEKNIIIFGDGEQTRDFVYVIDVVQALLLSMDKDVNGVFNVGTGFTSSINQLACNIIQLSNRKVEVIHMEARGGEVRHSCADITQAQEKLGYYPGYSLERGLFETYQWWKGT